MLKMELIQKSLVQALFFQETHSVMFSQILDESQGLFLFCLVYFMCVLIHYKKYDENSIIGH